MCDYCEYNSNFDLDNEDFSSAVSFRAFIDKASWWRPTIKFSTSIDLGPYGQIDIKDSFRINYCPICGRKLEDTENV